jgi:hypothetical protein
MHVVEAFTLEIAPDSLEFLQTIQMPCVHLFVMFQGFFLLPFFMVNVSKSPDDAVILRGDGHFGLLAQGKKTLTLQGRYQCSH